MAKAFVHIIKTGYRKVFLIAVLPVIKPFLAADCRFIPTCSEYAEEAILIHGAGQGMWLSLKRIGRCHPWGGAGMDLVPHKK
jgi:putative membrane protein insertion efficiency factor